MRFPRSVVSLAIGGLLVAACGGTPATSGPGGGTPTQVPAATDGGGPVVLPGNGSGKVNYEISGPVQKVGELPFFGVGSRFGGPAGANYSFTETDGAAAEIVSVFPDPSNPANWLVSYVAEDVQLSATACVMTNLQASDTSASGSFDCQNALVVNASGMYETNGRIKGTFEARA